LYRIQKNYYLAPLKVTIVILKINTTKKQTQMIIKSTTPTILELEFPEKNTIQVIIGY